jgi:hypothetical protein
MPRFLHIGPYPAVPTDIPDGMIVVTPHRAAASAIGVGSTTLRQLARKTVRNGGLRIASAVYARHTLKQAIAEVLPGRDAAAFASRIRQILETVLRTGIDADELIARGSTRVRELGKITRAYRSALKANGLIDPAELLLAAAYGDPEQHRMLIYGHHRARK